jgi:hypothetical protein
VFIVSVELLQLAASISDLTDWPHTEVIKLFGWFLHSQRDLDRFDPASIRECYDVVHLEKPSQIHRHFRALQQTSPKELLEDIRGYYLPDFIRRKMQELYGTHPVTQSVREQLLSLTGKVIQADERNFLQEVITCLTCKAYRSAIVMAWNLCFDHLCHYLLRHELTNFNRVWPVRFARKHAISRVSSIMRREHFGELQEWEVVEVCKSAAILSPDIADELLQRLKTRNSAAHPSNLIIDQAMAEAYVASVVNNIILRLPL